VTLFLAWFAVHNFQLMHFKMSMEINYQNSNKIIQSLFICIISGDFFIYFPLLKLWLFCHFPGLHLRFFIILNSFMAFLFRQNCHIYRLLKLMIQTGRKYCQVLLANIWTFHSFLNIEIMFSSKSHGLLW